MLNNILKIIPTIDKSGSFHTWAHIANNELFWSILINNICIDDPQPCNYLSEWKGEIPELHRCLILRLLISLPLLKLRIAVSVSGSRNYLMFLKSIPTLRNENLY